jgi:hypothetical protein
MPTWLKVTLIVIGSIILVVMVMGVGGYTWWKYNGETLMQDAQAADGEGRRFGAGKDSTACMEEGVRRTKGIGFSGAVAARLFLESCLKAAKLEAGFCDGVPGPTEILKSVSWQAQLNQKYGLHPPFESAVLPQSIVAFCESRLAPPPR